MAHIELQNVSRAFGSGKESVLAVDSVSFAIDKGRVRCLVGESGCGKSTTGKMIAGLLPPSSGRILFEGKDIEHLSPEEYRHYRHSVLLQALAKLCWRKLWPARLVFHFSHFRVPILWKCL